MCLLFFLRINSRRKDVPAGIGGSMEGGLSGPYIAQMDLIRYGISLYRTEDKAYKPYKFRKKGFKFLQTSSMPISICASFSSALSTAPTEIPRSSFFHDNGGLLALPNVAASAPPPYYIHRTTISHFLPLHLQSPDPVSSNVSFSCSSPSACQLPLPPHVPSSPSSSSGDLLEFSTRAMRRVFSTGDLQVMNVSPPPPVSGDTYSQDAGGPFTQKVGRYSAEERKEKIERYRVKRHQRNFHKKITYACRKTLADSRPRVQGRFARNVEVDSETTADLEREASGNSYEQCDYSDFTNNSSNYYDSLCKESGKSTTFDAGKWWWETPIEAAAANGHHHYQQQQLLGFDVGGDDEDELWASLADMCSGT